MTGNALYIDADFHTSSLSSIDTTVSRFSRYYKFWTNLVFINDILPAKTVTVFFLNCSYNHNLTSFRNQVEIFHDFCTVYGRYDTAALIRYATSADFCLCLISFIWVKCPVLNISNTYSVDVSIVSDNLVAGSHISDYVTLWVDDNFVKSHFFHLSSNSIDVRFFITAFTRISNDCT